MWRNKVNAHLGYDKLAQIKRALEMRIVPNGASVRFTGFLQIIGTGIRMRMEGKDNIKIVHLAALVWRNENRIVVPSGPANYMIFLRYITNYESAFLVRSCCAGRGVAPSLSQRLTDTVPQEHFSEIGHAMSQGDTEQLNYAQAAG